MRRAIFLGVLLFAALSIKAFEAGNLKVASLPKQDQGDEAWAYETSEEKVVLELFAKALQSEAELVMATYRVDTLKQSINDFWKLTSHPEVVSQQHYKFVNTADTSMYILFDCFVMKERKSATAVIDGYWDTETVDNGKGKKKKSVAKYTVEELPFRTFCLNSTVYVVDASQKAKSTVTNTFETFAVVQHIEELDIIPPQRNYIDRELAKDLKSVIGKWLSHYNLDINKFAGTSYNEPDASKRIESLETDSTSAYYVEYNKKEWDVYDPVLYDYSPNKKYYVNLLPTAGAYLDKDGKYYFYGSDDAQEVYLVNRDKGKIALIKWLGSSMHADAAFWKKNGTCVIVGRSDYDANTFFVECIGEDEGYYEYRTANSLTKNSYLVENVKKRGIKIEQ